MVCTEPAAVYAPEPEPPVVVLIVVVVVMLLGVDFHRFRLFSPISAARKFLHTLWIRLSTRMKRSYPTVPLR